MKEIESELIEIVNTSAPQLRKQSVQSWDFQKAPGKWSKKEILGHMIDSAANNHQRFVRAQTADKTPISYEGNDWVKAQSYTSAEIKTLIELWINYNLHLAHVISKIPADKYAVLFNADAKEPVSLEWLVRDYVKHLEHHLRQILGQE